MNILKQVAFTEYSINVAKPVSKIVKPIVETGLLKSTQNTSANKSDNTEILDYATQISNQDLTRPLKTSTTSAILSSNNSNIESLPKAIYDSLAPLSFTSKPIIYLDDKQDNHSITENIQNQGECNTLPTQTKSTDIATSENLNTTATEKDKTEISRLDEKAKLESILMSSMRQSNSLYNHKSICLLLTLCATI